MKTIAPLSEAERTTLRSMQEHHGSRRVRMRALGLLLSDQRYPLQEIARICDTTRQTVSSWIENWKVHGIAGLYDEPRSGRPQSLSAQDLQYLKELMECGSLDIRKVGGLLFEKTGKRLSMPTVRRMMKKAGRELGGNCASRNPNAEPGSLSVPVSQHSSEILWKKIKHAWPTPSAAPSLQVLRASVTSYFRRGPSGGSMFFAPTGNKETARLLPRYNSR